MKCYRTSAGGGGTSADGEKMPFDKNTEISRDFRVQAENQTMPMYLSNLGRCIWSEQPFKVTFKDGCIAIVVKGQTEKEIPLPEGKWKGYDGKIYEGGKTVTLSVTLEDLPYFKKIEG